ncbi:MAG: hypothetical protein C4528_05740 [Gammaproteobacteria bacterium]|nr:MAG: hypothetical protein C4528_05740 [Gammaproteobacteria bacterium]
MHLKLFRSNIRLNRTAGLLLVLLLLSATLHVSQHELVEGGSGPAGHSECQLSHVPGALWCASAPPPLLLILVFILAFISASPYTQTSLRLQPIRAPPLPS